MKIIQIIPCFNFGGAETMCENLIYSLSDRGHSVSAISLFDTHTAITERLEKRGIRIIYLNKKPGLDLTMFSKIFKVLKKEKPDIVHMHLNSIKYAAPAKRAKIKGCVYTVHNMADKDAAGLARKANSFYFKHEWIQPVALSEIVQDSINQVYGIEKDKIPVVYNGSDLSNCIVKKDYEIKDTVKLIHVGRFSAQKNHKGLLDSFAKIHSEYSNTTLMLLGDGEKREEMEQYAKSLGLEEHISFMGNQSNVYNYLSDSDMFVFPSIYEGVPMTLIEAMGTGLPIVATNVGGIPNMLTDRESASLVDCDAQMVYEACAELIENKSLREEYGRNAIKAAVKFSSQAMAEGYEGVYSILINSRKK